MKFKEMQKMKENEIEKKIEELKLELVKARLGKSKMKTKEIKKTIARLLTLGKNKIVEKKE